VCLSHIYSVSPSKMMNVTNGITLYLNRRQR
jgi:glucan phosphorylase